MSPFRFSGVGGRLPRADALAKATGRERFAADGLPPDCPATNPNDILWAGAKRAGVPHGRILRVDTSAASAAPGVTAVLTRADVTGSNRQGIIHKDQPVICGRKVRHAGDAVALVVAESKAALERALALIEVDIDPLPGVFDPASALAPGAPLAHEDREGGNLLLRETIAVGDAPSVLNDCAVVVRGSFETPAQEHAPIETEGGVAWMMPDGTLRMSVSTQAPFRDRFEIAQALGLDFQKIRIDAPFLGGGFGGKDGCTVQCLLALAALRSAGRPVRMHWSREESFLAGVKRHPARVECALGASADGALQAFDATILYDTGAYAQLGAEIMALGMEHAGGPYRIPNSRVTGSCVYTNNPVAGAFRGFGVAQTAVAVEALMDELAERLGRDPLELRLQNAIRPGDRNTSGVTMTHSLGVVECLRRIERHPLWRERRAWAASAPPGARRETGLSCVWHASGYGRGLADAAVARLELRDDGGFTVVNGVPDMGQGNSATYLQIAAQELRQEAASLDAVQPDTTRALPSGSASASRTTMVYGQALILACREMKKRLFDRAALMQLVDEPSGYAIVPGAVRHLPTGRDVPLAVLARVLSPAERVVLAQYQLPVPPERPDTGKGFVIGFPHLIFSSSAQVCRVEVDELTGRARVAAHACATDAGRVLNPTLYEQQVQGAVAQGLGYALMEDPVYDAGGMRAGDLSTYLIPTSMDLPEIESQAVETHEEAGPYGMKGLGEICMIGAAPAVASALAKACGRRPNRLPFTPERVLGLLADTSETA